MIIISNLSNIKYEETQLRSLEQMQIMEFKKYDNCCVIKLFKKLVEVTRIDVID